MDFRVIIILTVVAHSLKILHAIPHVFTDRYTFCEHNFNDGRKIIFPDKLWSIDNKDFTLHFSFCKSLQSKCKNLTSSCLIKKETNKIIDLGLEFKAADSDDFILQSVNGAKCPSSNQNYSITVNLECSDSIKPKPRLLALDDENECGFEVTMMKPDCRPKCTDIIHGAYMIDLRNFPKNIEMESDARKFSFSVCGSNIECGSRDVSSCEISNNGPTPLAKIESQSVNYDIGKNELTARGRFKHGRVIREFQVLIKCNWQTEVNNIVYKKVPIQGKNYKFELESSHGCVKLPPNCLLMSIDNLVYNLTSLSNPNGWQVSNVPEGKIVMNICGPLNLPENVCSDQHSQVCHINGKNNINRGSILLPLTVHEDVITAVFISGSTCAENTRLLYSTKIEFKCSKSEKGPVFKEYRECVMVLIWESPHACPIDFYRSQNCYMNDKHGNRNLQKLFTTTDKVYPLSSDGNVKLVYNLCGPIHQACNNFNNVSFCLKTEQKKDVIIGWDNREVISENGLLRMELVGSKCLNNRNHGQVTINFICNYEEPSPPPQIDIVEDGCKFKVNIQTPHACLAENTFRDCVYDVGDSCYDLSPLISKNRNYVVDDQNVEYILNVCGPIISGANALCKGNTMSCLRNKTEVNMKHQFTSLGAVSRPKYQNNSLIIESAMGAYCVGHGYYRTFIYFECSQRKFPPKILSKEPCTYKFQWRTPEACPVKKSCVVASSKSDNKLDLINLEEKILKINVNNGTNKYEFNLCADTYTKYDRDSSSVHPLKRDFYQINQVRYVELDLEENCDNISKINKVIFEFECDHLTDDYFRQLSFEDCALKMAVRTRIVCEIKEEANYKYSVVDEVLHESSTQAAFQITQKNKCVVKNPSTGYEFKVNKIKSKEMFRKKDHYALNFDNGLTNCNGLFCKNNIQILPMETCPVDVFDNTNSVIRLQYFTHSPCYPNELFRFEVWLSCDRSKTAEKVIKNERCLLIIEYRLPEACPLFPKKTVPMPIIASGVVGGILITCSIFVLYLTIKKYCQFRYAKLSGFSKTAVQVYTKDASV